jgi:MFS family permease
MKNQVNHPLAAVNVPLNYGYVIVIACFVIVMLNVGMFVSIGVFFKPILNEFGWSRAVTSGSISICALVTGLCSILTGSLTDKFGPRLVISICVFIAGVGYLLMSRLSGIWQLYFYLGLLSGIGSSALVPMLTSVPKWFTQHRTVMVGIISAGGGVGGLFVPLIAASLIGNYDWHLAYLILGGFYLVITMIAAQFLRRSPNLPMAVPVQILKTAPAPSEPAISLKKTFRSTPFWLSNLMFFCFGVSALTVQVHIVNHATDIHISPTGAAGLLSVINGVSIVGSIVLGGLGDKFGNRVLFILAFILICVSMIGLLFFDTLWQLNLFAIVFGLAFGAGLANAPALVSKLFGAGILGLILGITSLSQTLGGSIGGYLAGYIFDSQNSYRTIFIICAMLGLVGMTATFFLKPSKEKA